MTGQTGAAICAIITRAVEFFIVVKKHANVTMKAVHALPASAWNPFQPNEELSRGGRSGRRRKRRENRKRKITIEHSRPEELVQRQARDSVDGISP